MTRSLEELFHAELQDALSAETQLLWALAEMASAATCLEVKDRFQRHLEETQFQVERLEQICKDVGCPAGSAPCEPMRRLIAQVKETIESEAEDLVRDAGLIIAAQKLEHYQIALYGGLCTLAFDLGKNDVAAMLQLSLDEEKQANKKLSRIALNRINTDAASA